VRVCVVRAPAPSTTMLHLTVPTTDTTLASTSHCVKLQSQPPASKFFESCREDSVRCKEAYTNTMHNKGASWTGMGMHA
jgi:hypothetical protein